MTQPQRTALEAARDWIAEKRRVYLEADETADVDVADALCAGHPNSLGKICVINAKSTKNMHLSAKGLPLAVALLEIFGVTDKST